MRKRHEICDIDGHQVEVEAIEGGELVVLHIGNRQTLMMIDDRLSFQSTGGGVADHEQLPPAHKATEREEIMREAAQAFRAAESQ